MHEVNSENNQSTSPNSNKNITRVNPIPELYAGATPYLYVNMASAALEFYKQAFNAEVLIEINNEQKRIAHAEILIGKARIMISDEFPEMDCYSPRHLGGTTFGIILYFEDSDVIFKQAILAGAQEISKVEDLFCGDRGGKIVDPFGHQWFIYTRKENISYEELKKKGESFFLKH